MTKQRIWFVISCLTMGFTFGWCIDQVATLPWEQPAPAGITFNPKAKLDTRQIEELPSNQDDKPGCRWINANTCSWSDDFGG